MKKIKIGVLQKNADLQLRASFVRKFGVHLAPPEFVTDETKAIYGRSDNQRLTKDQAEFIHTFLDGWRSCAFTFERLLLEPQNWADNPLEG